MTSGAEDLRRPVPAASPDAELAASVGATSRFADVGGVRLHYVEAGRGPLVVLLHGFPNFWYLWRRQIVALAAGGFRVVAPDLRGYNLSDKPPGVASYRLGALGRDVLGLLDALRAPDAAIVGHDWGGVIGWRLAEDHARAVRRLVVLNAPHPAAFRRELRSAEQMARSAYAAFFQLPALPELLLRARNFALVERVLRREPTRPDAFTDDDVRRHKTALARPGALTAMLDYYRALARAAPRELRRTVARITRPTLVVWGERDRYLRRCLSVGLDRWAADLRVVRLPDASHWVPADAPEDVNELLLEFCA
jgi:epoxide hydrolase 4